MISGQYIYMEASSPRRLGDKARLVGINNNPTSLSSCFQFYYHMKGVNIGKSATIVRTLDDKSLTVCNKGCFMPFSLIRIFKRRARLIFLLKWSPYIY